MEVNELGHIVLYATPPLSRLVLFGRDEWHWSGIPVGTNLRPKEALR
jgi:hypothetical protein